MDILKRWTYPLCPDIFNATGQFYSHTIKNVYEASSTDIERSTILKSEVQVGQNTIIRQNCKITNSVIGSNCVIGSNVILDHAFIFDNVTIGDDCKLFKSVVSQGCTILEKVSLNNGCLLGPSVVIGPGVDLPQKTLVSIEPSDSSSPSELGDNKEAINLGSKSVGQIFIPELYDDEIIKFKRGAIGIIILI